MLEHLYDLLEERRPAGLPRPPRRLPGLPGGPGEGPCAQQKLLAAAAACSSPPCSSSATSPEPVAPARCHHAGAPRLPRTAPRPRRRTVAWGRWAVAAGLLLALAGLGVPAHRYRQRLPRRRKGLAIAQLPSPTPASESMSQNASRAGGGRPRSADRTGAPRRQGDRAAARRVRAAHRPARRSTDFLVRVYDLNGRPAAPTHVRDPTPTTHGEPGPIAELPPGLKGRADRPPSGSSRRTSNERHELPVVSPGRGAIASAFRRRCGWSRADRSPWSSPPAARVADAPTRAVTLQGKVQLTAPVYLTHLTTDKPMYQPGETVRFRSLTWTALTPAAGGRGLPPPSTR